MRRVSVLIILMLALLSLIGTTMALEVETSVRINDQYVKSDQKNLLIDDRVYVVARFVTEALGGEIDWIGETQQVLIRYGDKNISMAIGSERAMLNGVEYLLDAPPFLRNGRTYIPLRFVAENYESEVNWVQNTYTVDIQKDGYEVPTEKIEPRWYTDDDLLWLSRIVTVETGRSGSLEKKLAIANVALNRVKSERFPNTVHEVIFQKGQYPPTKKESFQTLEADGLSIVAAKKALEGVNNIDACLFHNYVPFKNKDDDFYKRIEGEYFYK